MKTLVITVNVAALLLLVMGVLLVTVRNEKELGTLSCIAGMVFAVLGLFSSIMLYRGWL